MEREEFFRQVSEQLQRMSAKQKDNWIMTYARLLSEAEQEDFLMSLYGEKRILYMPTMDEIKTFCEKVQSGDIYLEYEARYFEFDSEGRYMDDWEIWHNDIYHAFDFLERVFRGCHDLLKLDEYDLAGTILEKVCGLEFSVVEAKESEDFADDSLFRIADGVEEGLLSVSTRAIGYDWCVSFLMKNRNNVNGELAGRLLDILELELCKDLQLSDILEYISEELLELLDVTLENRIQEYEDALERIRNERQGWYEQYAQEKKVARCRHLQLDIRKKCRKEDRETGSYM